MLADDRVLVAYVPSPADFNYILAEKWYRIPQKFAPKGLYAEYIAFYFGRAFNNDKWAIHSYAPNLGHELAYRIDLLPHEPHHPHAHDVYYRVQLGELVVLPRPIVSLHWRRVLFIHTTGDRFQEAMEINDLLVEGGYYVDREEVTLREVAEIYGE
jgi:hypothetical protein